MRTPRIDYDALPALYSAAHRERAQEVHRLLIAPVIALFKKRPLRRSRMLQRSAYC